MDKTQKKKEEKVQKNYSIKAILESPM